MNLVTKFHYHCKKGWLNDPNGFVYFKGKYHLFYQYSYSNNTMPGLMGWGHAISDDLVTFTELEPAFFPDKDYDKDGCWSGSSFVKDDVLYILYTGNKLTENGPVQTQNLVISTDGVTFKKYENNPVITPNMLPEGFSQKDFRDPSLYKENDTYYVLLGNNTIDNVATLHRFKSNDLINYEFDTTLFSKEEFGYMIECPSSAKIDDKRVFIMSPQGIPLRDNDFWNVYSSIYTVSDLGITHLDMDNYDEIDHGLEFYAPQIISDGNILISWLQIWERNYPLHDLHNDYNNCMTIPRRLELVNNKLMQRPIETLEKYFIEKANFVGFIKEEIELKDFEGQYEHLHFEFKNEGDFSFKFFKKEREYGEVRFKNHEIIVDKNHAEIKNKSYKKELSSCGYRKVKVNSEFVTLDVYLDRINFEVYVNNGEAVLANTLVNSKDAIHMSFASKSGIEMKMSIKEFKD